MPPEPVCISALVSRKACTASRMLRRASSLVAPQPVWSGRRQEALFENEEVAAVLCAGQVAQGLVRGDEDAVFLHCEAEQIRVRNLLVPKQPALKRRGKGGPAGGDWPKAITRMLRKALEEFRCRLEGAGASGSTSDNAQKTRFGESTYAPARPASGTKPIGYEFMMDVLAVGEGDQRVDVEQMPRAIQRRPPGTS
jgi:hypothetical protein